MTKITDILFNTYYKPYRRYILIASLIIIFLIIGIKMYNNASKPLSENKDDIANANRQKKPADIYFFSAKWCPHCVKAQPIFSSFKETYDQTIVNGYTINCIEVDCSSNDDSKITEMLQQFKVDHFPTIKLVKDKTVIDFDAKISEANLTTFVNSVL